MKWIVFAIALFIASPVFAQSPSVRERADQAFIVGSLSMSSIALGLTMSCTATGECRELNPVMRKFIGDGPTKAVVVKAAVNGGTTLAIWRFTRGKTRTIALAAMCAFNAWDAIHDIREMRKIDR